MKTSEIIRIILCIILGYVLMFYVQPLIYENGIIQLGLATAILKQVWFLDYYQGAWLVFAFSVIATIAWYVLAAKAKIKGGNDTSKWSVVWWLFLLLPVLSTLIAIVLFKDKSSFISLSGLYILDGVFLLYWLPTATSSPGLLRNIPPGSQLLRSLIGD